MTVLAGFYVSGALYFFSIWFQAFQKDTNLSPDQIRSSWIVLTIASIFWPIVAPIANLEKSSRKKDSLVQEQELDPNKTGISPELSRT
ncbi:MULTISPECIES: hypothetical protein [Moorena]|uniref:Uncharacterized protein n=1 Tax=Moorena producens 3L TaxID=489825 RepID=F4XXD3_9CYAN|nr:MULTISPECIES: hypothetical protein [Moorena]NES81403.1 hypothetical protein [Moorena sp. SIO2B7]EGJ30792.1 hypothetical protein LYNGBM3L_46890 [Moorena producens 3L]NEP33420.1 hypothetical protein [Moorena sp. SIO3B2]NEP65401.1 hypothetical protein [Moorena sp. SIO3A5]NEQ05764.1 hypothetical protein [Moorena sp. SIO4E2]